MRKILIPVALALPLLGGGCLVKTAANVVTLPVKAAGQTVDWATTSQDEADRNAGRKLRKEDQKRAKEERKARREQARQEQAQQDQR
ncbi:hypothetical protein NDN01_00595 [Sphingomonas sp. QA11]|jgi:hypothetical protein|uniref:Lipoprotein n=1 Tax=hydrothermal vent metagenome TaxID=652676 RepID=A0A160TPJ6_9ZZZZ|nr:MULTISPECIES: hypothetical protein [unclassified Sphingomonas]WCM27470.1 hypothetical protein NDN01_00595 [Sphingomonas sp. QA11]WEJ98070.1 MAG: hypothetical protein P0Y59_14015 [Sphingomonas sp.]